MILTNILILINKIILVFLSIYDRIKRRYKKEGQHIWKMKLKFGAKQ